MKNLWGAAIGLALASVFFCGCDRIKGYVSTLRGDDRNPPVARVYDTYLYRSDLHHIVPKGSSAQDSTQQQDGEESTQEQTTVVYSGADGEEVVLLTQYYPSFRGALVVCAGGDDPQVRLAVTQAVSALTGLGSDRITVCAGQS